MPEKYHNKYRISSARLQNWDYGSNASYFVTIRIQNSKHIFGVIENGEMLLNDIGKKAETCFIDIPIHFPFVEMGPFVVMPDHVHAIITINKTVETQNFASLLRIPEPSKQQSESSKPSYNKFGPQSENLASIIRGYKIGVTKFAKTIYPEFAWQPRYHDHVIRDIKSFKRIQKYIINNPRKWNGENTDFTPCSFPCPL
jgi:REP element-mobilizing transposase RayT